LAILPFSRKDRAHCITVKDSFVASQVKQSTHILVQLKFLRNNTLENHSRI